MTNDKDCDEPFQVVLIDIQKAAKGEIDCVKKTLTKELKYVAISYRWGELQELNMDTKVGYVASITSFDINDFYRLCEAMIKESDVKSMDYVWLDAICVNQSSDEREATIYHMTEIYEHATWILAVPDLNAEHLKGMTCHREIMECIKKYRDYLYYLLHRNAQELHRLDESFLDSIGVPQDPKFREILTKETGHFAKDFLRGSLYDLSLDELVRIFKIYRESNDYKYEKVDSSANVGNEGPDIFERRKHIYQAMYFLKDLVIDWSSRVWVISEFHISKKRNNLKFWFTQLNDDMTSLTFFKLDKGYQRPNHFIAGSITSLWDSIYANFYDQLFVQLNSQSFLEMMLKSKASKNEDRFYSIFPLFPQYKDLVQKEKDLIVNTSSILSVKLKLYQLTTDEHKIRLLCLSAKGRTTYTLPTFATTFIDWGDLEAINSIVREYYPFDIDIVQNTKIDNGLYYLRVTPKAKVDVQVARCIDAAARRLLAQLLHPDNYNLLKFDVVRLPGLWSPYLMGSFTENKWILVKYGAYEKKDNDRESIKMDLPKDFPGFHVY